jgi:hypothetical protein
LSSQADEASILTARKRIEVITECDNLLRALFDYHEMGSSFEVAICDLKRLGRWRRMGNRSSKRTDPRSSIAPAERGVIQKSGGEIAGLPAGYGELLGEIKARIARSRIEAALAANHVLIDLYWHIGRSIVERQKLQGWGRSVVERLARDIQAAFPGIPGFSQNNIWRMRAFYLAYTE